MMDDPLEQCEQRLMASLDLAIRHAATTDPLVYAGLRSLRERLSANLTTPQGLRALEAESAEVHRQ